MTTIYTIKYITPINCINIKFTPIHIYLIYLAYLHIPTLFTYTYLIYIYLPYLHIPTLFTYTYPINISITHTYIAFYLHQSRLNLYSILHVPQCYIHTLPVLIDQGVDIVIALTHMRWPNDRRLAAEANDLDIILGGHDHEYDVDIVRTFLTIA